ncbi:MAG TPA: hypothetical protein VGM63_17140 [Mucilaginibacter sp.]|jgi:hypothetical protein
MTLYDFNSLEEHQKAESVWQGTFLADREENGLILQLYGIDTFYVEVCYDDRAGKILGFRSFHQVQQLTPYLAHIRFNGRD